MSKQRSQRTTEDLPVWPEQVIGGKYIRLLEKQLQTLREEAGHGNQALFLDDVFVVYLLAFFNPSVRSLRTIEDFSQTRQIQKHLSIRKICKSTLSDFNQLADPARLEPILTALRGQLSRKQAGRGTPPSGLQALLKQTIAVDGTFLPAVAEVAWAVAGSNNHASKHHRARVDVHLNVASWLPEAIVIPEVGQSEADSAKENLQPGNIYVYDRGYMSYALLKTHYKEEEDTPQSSFVVRFKPEGGNSPRLQEASERPLSDEDRAAGVLSDRVGYFISKNARQAKLTKIPLREVQIAYEDQGKPKTLRLITNLMDVSAHTIGLLYRHRWQVELFFRWLKSFGNFGHLISHTRAGVQMHFYVTLIAMLLMYLHTGHRPSKYMFALLSQVAVGAATLEEVLPILRERERRNELERQSAARRAAKKLAAGK